VDLTTGMARSDYYTTTAGGLQESGHPSRSVLAAGYVVARIVLIFDGNRNFHAT